MHSEPDALPLRVQAHEAESGMSYVLRTLCANGISVGRAGQWLGFRIPQRFSARQIDRLAWVTGTGSDWLQARFLSQQRGLDRMVWEYLGHHFLPGTGLRDLSTPICVSCVLEHGYCEASWTVSSACICPHHRTPLLDCCPNCGTPVTWNRPAVDVCRCGRYFQDPPGAPTIPPPSVTTWVQWIRWRLASGSDVGAVTTQPGLPRLLGLLSVDGAFRVVHAFGVLTNPHQVPRTADALRHQSPAAVCDIVKRGLDRLGAIDGTSINAQAIASSVHLPELIRLARSGIHNADRIVAKQLLGTLTGKPPKSKPSSAHPPTGQLDLFPADDDGR